MKKSSVTAVLFAVLAIIMSGFRIFQSLNMIDSKTGFYFKEYENYEPVFLVVLFVLIIAYFIIAMATVKFPKLRNCRIKSKPLGICTLVLATTAAGRSVYYCVSKTSSSVQSIIMTVIFVVMTVFLAYYGVCLLTDKKPAADLFIIPTLFAGFRFAVTFISYVDVIKVTDIVLTIIMLGLCMVFWHMFARVNAGIATKNTVKILFGAGFPAALMCFVCAIPKYFITLFSPESGVHISDHIAVFDIASGIYIAVFLIMMINAEIKVDTRVEHLEATREENTDEIVRP